MRVRDNAGLGGGLKVVAPNIYPAFQHHDTAHSEAPYWRLAMFAPHL
jgi:hypothetical protein